MWPERSDRRAARHRAVVTALAAALAVVAGDAAAQATGSVEGVVVDAVSARPVAGARVLVPGTQREAVTDPRGRFLLRHVPIGERTLRVEGVGYEPQEQTVRVAAGRTVSLLVRVARSTGAHEQRVVAGLVGATPQSKLGVGVDRIRTDTLPVPPFSAAGYLRGRVAGVTVMSGSGQPGEELDILLRGARSINASGRGQAPLVIVDGVVTMAGLEGIEPQDIAVVEVVKGAAGGSLFGSRGGNGVVWIATKRGRQPGGDRIRYTFRSEYGANDLAGSIALNRAHPYAMNASTTRFVDTNGAEFEYADTTYALQLAGDGVWDTFQENPYPECLAGACHDHLERVFTAGAHRSNYFSVEGASGRTNFFLSAANLKEEGVVRYHDGYERTTFRLNVDHAATDRFRLSGSAAYALAEQDELVDGGGAFRDLTFMPPFADLLATTPDGEVIIAPDPRQDRANPLYGIQNREVTDNSSRIMASVRARYRPVDWLDLDADLGYDRRDWDRFDFVPRGYKTITPSAINDGQLRESSSIHDALNAALAATLHHAVGDLKTRTTARALYEERRYDMYDALGRRYGVEDVPELELMTASADAERASQHSLVEGYSLISALDYRDRYIMDALVRRDGSSRFGADQRWQTYYRSSFAWRMARERWWPIPAVNELTLRFAVGTAGVEPSFSAQYDIYGDSAGTVSLAQLGNRGLRPERITGRETGVSVRLFDRLSFDVTYARTVAADQIDEVTLPGYAGFRSQWQNVGTLESATWEASLEASLLDAPDTAWRARVLFDRTASTVTELNVPCYRWGIGRDGLADVFYNCAGVAFGTIYGTKFATGCSDLPVDTPCDQFAVNSDGYLVWTGGAGIDEGLSPSPWDSVAADGADILWEATGDVNGTVYHWGSPIAAWGTDGDGNPTQFLPLGNVVPDFNVALSNDIVWKGLNLFVLFDASIGFDIYNRTRQLSAEGARAGEMDQVGVPDTEKKPYGYYQVLYDAGGINSHYVEDGSFVKLREVVLRYTFGQDRLGFMPIPVDRVTVSLIGRNLATWTGYSGYDPEVGSVRGARGGSAAINRLDAFVYPKYRTITGAVEIVF